MGNERRVGDWAYVSLLTALPGVKFSLRRALALQFAIFEGAALVIAAWYGLWTAVPVATVAIAVSTLGSWLMVTVTDEIRAQSGPAVYRETLFGSSVDVAMGLVAFTALLTYLFVDGYGPAPGLLAELLGARPPALALFLGFLVGWDLCYRIGTGWWASIVGLWRSVTLRDRLNARTRRAYARADRLTIAFAALQLALVPFLEPAPVLAGLLLGHVGAVMVVSGVSIILLTRVTP